MPSFASSDSDGATRRLKNILLTGGRAPATLELARLCAMSGHRVFVAESFSSHLSRYARSVERSFKIPAPNGDAEGFLEALIDVIDTEKIDLLIPTCEEVFHIANHHQRLSRHCRVFCEDLEHLDQLHNKYALNNLVRSFGLPAPKTLLLPDSGKFRTALTDWLQQEGLAAFVVKPVYGRFGTNVHRFPRGLERNTRLPDLCGRRWIAQEFIRGTSLCTYSVADGGKLRAHATYPVRFTAGGSAITFQSVRHPGIERWVDQFVRRFHYTGQIGFDFIEDAEGKLYPLDCNPRVTSGIHLFDNAADFADVFLEDPCPLRLPDSDRVRCVRAAVPLFGLGGIRSLPDIGFWLKTILLGRDVVFRWRDPIPAVHQFVALARFAWRSRFYHTSLIEATTRDIQWDGADNS